MDRLRRRNIISSTWFIPLLLVVSARAFIPSPLIAKTAPLTTHQPIISHQRHVPSHHQRQTTQLTYIDERKIIDIDNVYMLSDTEVVDRDTVPYGTKVHLFNAMLGLSIPMLLFGKTIPFISSLSLVDNQFLLSSLIIEGGFIGMVIDNLINGFGRYIGEGSKLRNLTRIRLALHGLTVPSMFVPAIELGKHARIISSRVSRFAIGFFLSYAFVEVIEWLFLYDVDELQVVDNSDLDSKKNNSRYIDGVLSYTCGKVVKCVVPAVTLCLSTMAMGNLMRVRGVAAGPWLLGAGGLSFAACSCGRADIQAFGETTQLTMTMAALASAASSVC